ncbi:hypothetical protein FGSG_04925 [Fusarium graminearum PH-1]|uniref:Chromosome 3, complete genome n=1 Tax=Gibberella zeae (strain ATCC MYA-4620 / CBS 123657 / FGSC 9075 / NRRL 31084 / PH-1) TaxID=229533 RepID=I1RLV5_GIBZE|nr:hypothetical protein FGSG_04925 [Fusarium graminearum PH-1]ESU10820.1 hypothetical protein FGSG_04925 [Fusarium graminearum PH-1]CEF88897.1 unnamed protein product [Fusarium graminearum]|eukprot:XP_011323396.1 hypothetical protein FGSG_04925 [Fusarium graminearum PH-1]
MDVWHSYGILCHNCLIFWSIGKVQHATCTLTKVINR